MTKKLEFLGGAHIRDAVSNALAAAIQGHESVKFEFNGSTYTVNPDDTYETAKARAEGVLGHPILTAEAEAARARDDMDRMTREQAEAIAAAHVQTEAELRAADVPWPKTPEDLAAYIAGLVNRPHDYGTCVYAMSMAAVSAYYYVATTLGTTGFQSSCADLDILRRTRHIDGPFILLKAEDILYPQYDLRARLEEFITQSAGWCRDEAQKKLADAGNTHPDVRRRWEELAARS